MSTNQNIRPLTSEVKDNTLFIIYENRHLRKTFDKNFVALDSACVGADEMCERDLIF